LALRDQHFQQPALTLWMIGLRPQQRERCVPVATTNGDPCLGKRNVAGVITGSGAQRLGRLNTPSARLLANGIDGVCPSWNGRLPHRDHHVRMFETDSMRRNKRPATATKQPLPKGCGAPAPTTHCQPDGPLRFADGAARPRSFNRKKLTPATTTSPARETRESRSHR